MKNIDEVLELWKDFESRCNTARSTQIDRIKEDRRFLGGQQWDKSDNKLYPRGRPRRVINVLSNSVTSTVNSYAGYPYKWYSANQEIDAIGNAFLKAGQNSRAPYDALYNSVAFGLGYMAIGSEDMVDNTDGTTVSVPALYSIDLVENVYFDPDSKNMDGSDAVEAAIVEYRSKAWVKAKYGEKWVTEEGVKPQVNTHDNGNSETMVIVTYFRVEDGQCSVYRLLNEDFLEDPVQLGISRVPVFPTYGERTFDDDDDMLWQGLTRKGREVQRTINQAFTQLSERMAMAPKPTIITTPEAIEGYEDGYRTFQYNLNPIAYFNDMDETTKRELKPPTRIDNSVRYDDITGIISANLELLSTITGVDAKGLIDGTPQVTATEVIYNEKQTQCTIRHYFQNLKDSFKSAGETIMQLLGKGKISLQTIQGPAEYMEKQVCRQALTTLCGVVPEQSRMKLVDGILLSFSDNPIMNQVFGMLHSAPEPTAMEQQAFDTIETMKQALDQKNQELQQLRDEIKRMSDNAANNDKSLLAEFLKLKLQHEYGQQDTILKAQLDQGADTAKAEAESTKAELGVQKEILSLEEQKLKTTQAFAGDVKNEA